VIVARCRLVVVVVLVVGLLREMWEVVFLTEIAAAVMVVAVVWMQEVVAADIYDAIILPLDVFVCWMG
jgi:hypothetical protein